MYCDRYDRSQGAYNECLYIWASFRKVGRLRNIIGDSRVDHALDSVTYQSDPKMYSSVEASSRNVGQYDLLTNSYS